MPSHILLADDDCVSRDVLKHVLANRGHAVSVADNGLAALDLLREHYFDLVILDYHMPLLDGIGTAKQAFDETSSKARPRFIGVTADPYGLEARDQAREVFDAIVQKPINIAALLGVIESSLRQLRASVSSHNILSQWQMSGFDRRPRALLASGVLAHVDRDLEAFFDFTKPENPDVVLLTRGMAVETVEVWRTAGNLFTVPTVDATGQWSRVADAVFAGDERETWAEVAKRATSFAERRMHLTNRYMSATCLSDQLLAYIYVSGCEFNAVPDPLTEAGITYPGMFPSRAVLFAVRRLEQEGLLRRVAWSGMPPAAPSATRFALTEQAIQSLTGALAADAFPRASFLMSD